MSATKKFVAAHSGFVDSRPTTVGPRTPWAWPQAALAIILLSVLLWGGIASIALIALN